MVLQPCKVKRPDLARRDAEHLAENSVTDIGGMSELRHDGTKLQFEQVVNLLISEVFDGLPVGVFQSKLNQCNYKA